MNQETPTQWPQTPDGVTDWENVFEDGKSGFIVLIRTAQSPETLKDCATVVVQQLFSRDGDSMAIMKFIIDLEGILPDSEGKMFSDDEVDGMRDTVSAFLRKIKNDRIKKAQDHLDNQAGSGERRLT
jgi:hypothetical protein